MKQNVSIYLDLLRVAAALTVVAAHLLTYLWPHGPFRIQAHDAVIAFFVISGYVIAFTADKPGVTPQGYILDRLSRLWSVQVPAAFIAGAVFLIVDRDAASELPAAIATWPQLFWDTLTNLLFQGQGWSASVDSPFNQPLWSVNYEAWYYAIFGAWIFLPGRVRWIAAAALCAAAGPKILALMPCWLAGVALYRYGDRIKLPESRAFALFLLSIALYATAYIVDIQHIAVGLLQKILAGERYDLEWSSAMLSDYLTALLAVANICAFANMPSFGADLLKIGSTIRTAASYTLSLYLYHTPLAFLLIFGLGLGKAGIAGAAIVILALAASIIILGKQTEHRRADWRRHLARFARFGAIRPA